MSINIHIQKKDLWLLSAIAVFLIGVAYVIAYDWTTGSGTGPPSIHGHTANEIEGLTGGGSCSLGDWTTTGTLSSGGEETFVRDHVYVAQTDGFVIAIGAAVGSGDSQSIFIIYSDSNNPPTTKKYRFIQQLSGSGRNIAPTGVIPVKKGDYFNVTYTYGGNNQPISAIYWIPLNCGGSGGGASCMWYDFVQYVTNAEFEANGGTGICRWTRSSVWYYGSMMAYGGGINEQIGCVVPGVIWMGNEAGQYYGCK